MLDLGYKLTTPHGAYDTVGNLATNTIRTRYGVMTEHQCSIFKCCSKCDMLLPLEDFSPEKKGRHGRKSVCRRCLAQYIRELCARHKERFVDTKDKNASFVETSLKRCSFCKKEWPLFRFVRDLRSRDGREYRCKACYTLPAGAAYADYVEHIERQQRRWLLEIADTTNKKYCGKCEQFLALEVFGKNKTHADGLTSICNSCRNSQRRLEYQNHEVREHMQAQGLSYRIKPEAKEHKSSYDKELRKLPTHRIRKLASHQKRRATKRQALPNNPLHVVTPKRLRALYDIYGRKCVYCQKKLRFAELHWDHVIPLVKGGLHAIDNLVPSCVSCNLRKHANPPTIPVQSVLLLPI